jgi:hypothetical protein
LRLRLGVFTDSAFGVCLSAVRLLLVPLSVAIAAVGYASPIDPSWISGYYDDADHDDVVILVTESLGLSSSPGAALVPMPSVDLQPSAGAPRTSRRLMILQDERGPPSRFETFAA